MWHFVGQDKIIQFFQGAITHDKLAHAYLFVGSPHIGKMTLACQVAQAVNCLYFEEGPCHQCRQCKRIETGLHADVQVISLISSRKDQTMQTRKEISIDQIRQLQRDANLKPFEGQCRTFILDGAENLSKEAAHSLLKTLEEPPAQVLILLLVSEVERLLSTIRSRCHTVQFHPMPQRLIEQRLIHHYAMQESAAHRLARLSRGCFGRVQTFVQNPTAVQERHDVVERIQSIARANIEKRLNYAAELARRFSRDRFSVYDELDEWLCWWRDVLLVQVGAKESIENLEYLTQLVEDSLQMNLGQVTEFLTQVVSTIDALDSNANPRLALEVLLLDVPSSLS